MSSSSARRTSDDSVLHRTLRRAATAAGILALAAGTLDAQEMAVPARVQFPLFTRILAFDRNLERGGGGEIVIAILYQARFRMSLTACESMVAAARDGGLKSIQSLPVRPVPIDIEGERDLGAALASSGARILYVAPLRSVDIGAICSVARELKITSMTGVPRYVEEGVALGIGVRDERPQILVNLPEAEQEGADFSSQLLRVAKVLR